MTDVVDRLREGVFGGDETKTDAVIHMYMQVAAAEIGRLRAIIRVNGLRHGATHKEVDDILYPGREDD